MGIWTLVPVTADTRHAPTAQKDQNLLTRPGGPAGPGGPTLPSAPGAPLWPGPPCEQTNRVDNTTTFQKRCVLSLADGSPPAHTSHIPHFWFRNKQQVMSSVRVEARSVVAHYLKSEARVKICEIDITDLLSRQAHGSLVSIRPRGALTEQKSAE